VADQPQDARDLAEFAERGSAEAFARLSSRYAGLVYRVCLRRLASEADAEDATQAVFLALARKAGSVRPERLASWLHGASLRAARFIARSRANRARYEREAARMKSVEAETGTGDGGESREALAHLDAEVARLPAKLREAVTRHYLAGLTRAELARELGVPEGTVQSRLSAGLEKLRARLGGRGVRLGAAALAGLLTSEVQAGAPASLTASLPTLVTGPAAAGAAAGAGAGVSLIAEGVLKAMLWAKLKVAAAVVAAATVAAGAGTPLAIRAVAGGGNGKKNGPDAGATAKVIRARVVRIMHTPQMGGRQSRMVTLDKGSADGVKKGFVFEIYRGKLRVNRIGNISAVTEKTSVGNVQWAAGLPKWKSEVKIGDIATTRLRVADPKNGGQPKVVVKPNAVKGLRLWLRYSLLPGWRGIKRVPVPGPDGIVCPPCVALDPFGTKKYKDVAEMPLCLGCGKGINNAKYCMACSMRLQRCFLCGKRSHALVYVRTKVTSVQEVTGHVALGAGSDSGVRKGFVFRVYRGDEYIGKVRVTTVWNSLSGGTIVERKQPMRAGDDATRDAELRLRWENVSNKPLVLRRDRCCDLYDHVFMKGPDGRLVPARTDNRARLRHARRRAVLVEPGKHDEERFDPWHWVVKPTKGGEYTIWVEFEQKVPPKPVRPDYWTGKVRSNEVKINLAGTPARTEAEKATVREIYAKGRKGDLSAAMKYLAHESDWVRFSAVDCIGTFGKPEHYPLVVARLGKEEPGSLARGGIVFALGRLGGGRAVKHLLSLLAGNSAVDRRRAAKVLRGNREFSRLPEVQKALQKYDARLKKEAAPKPPQEVF
jgi:RNA polymerase sigma factor (sigma-70 family)